MNWTLARAKDQLSELVRRTTTQGPQTITIRGREAAVVLDKAEYDRMRSSRRPEDFKAFLMAIPSLEGVEIERNPSLARDTQL
ncbi:MAG: hypothetical protein JWM33_224 [Caulobacteraceae bacterium]|nr:hypothetical protein [Caulobacteraceae bacterium]